MQNLMTALKVGLSVALFLTITTAAQAGEPTDQLKTHVDEGGIDTAVHGGAGGITQIVADGHAQARPPVLDVHHLDADVLPEAILAGALPGEREQIVWVAQRGSRRGEVGLAAPSPIPLRDFSRSTSAVYDSVWTILLNCVR